MPLRTPRSRRRPRALALPLLCLFGLGVGTFAGSAHAQDAADAADAVTDGADAASTGDDAGGVSDAGPIVGSACSPTDDQCERADFTVEKLDKIAGDFDWDTGWIPSGSAVQIRLLVYLHGRVDVSMGGTLRGAWPSPITLTPDARLGTGSLAIDDGFVVEAQARFHVTIAGKDYSWSGDIPGLPKVDIAATGTTSFDPWAWDLGMTGPAGPSVSATSPAMPIAKISLTDSIIPIPGIDGGFELAGDAQYFASYLSERIGFDELTAPGTTADVTPLSASTRFPFSASPALDTQVFVHGTLTHGVTLHFIPAFYFTIVGSTFTLDLADLPLPLGSKTKALDFAPVAIHLPLPEIDVQPPRVDVGNVVAGSHVPLLLTIANLGEARLKYAATDPTGTVIIPPAGTISVDPGSTTTLSPTLIAPTATGPFDVTLKLTTNDPLRPTVAVHIVGNGASAEADAGADAGATIGTDAHGGCACSTGPGRSRAGERGEGGALVVVAIAVTAALGRRSRRRAHARPTSHAEVA
jgi:hypothetical protein